MEKDSARCTSCFKNLALMATTARLSDRTPTCRAWRGWPRASMRPGRVEKLPGSQPSPGS